MENPVVFTESEHASLGFRMLTAKANNREVGNICYSLFIQDGKPQEVMIKSAFVQISSQKQGIATLLNQKIFEIALTKNVPISADIDSRGGFALMKSLVNKGYLIPRQPLGESFKGHGKHKHQLFDVVKQSQEATT